MHEFAQVAHVLDREETLVVDDPDSPAALVDDEEEVMRHVHVLGLWHRRTPDLRTTACGVPFNGERALTRAAELFKAHLMCRDCFTPYEIERAAKADAKEED